MTHHERDGILSSVLDLCSSKCCRICEGLFYVNANDEDPSAWFFLKFVASSNAWHFMLVSESFSISLDGSSVSIRVPLSEYVLQFDKRLKLVVAHREIADRV